MTGETDGENTMIYTLDDRAIETEGDLYVAPSARVIGRVRFGHEANVWFNVVIRGDEDVITIGPRTNVQDGSVLHVDAGVPLTVGAGVTIGHCVMLHGCTIGDGSLIGIGATVLNHARVGARSIVGAHALVTEGKEFPDGVLILGSPAKVVRELTDEELAGLEAAAAHYVENARRFRRALAPDARYAD
jgi:carbonic anhydrase/acetyltransferase-like protein (isoleucine patch superfamily)